MEFKTIKKEKHSKCLTVNKQMSTRVFLYNISFDLNFLNKLLILAIIWMNF